PADTASNYGVTMWHSFGNIVDFASFGNYVRYKHNADVFQGQSGSPNFYSPDGINFYIVGIQSTERYDGNYSAGINPASFADIQTWSAQ
ncbi:hypothetical protein, partial [Bacillus toyonensis]